MSTKKIVDMNVPREFFDPHPGFAGAAIPIPGPIKRVADALDGQTLSLKEAVSRLQAVGIGTVEVVPEHDYIGLRLGDTSGRYVSHFFRVIRFR